MSDDRIPTPLEGADDDWVDIKVAVAISGLSRATIYRRITDPTDDFPRPAKLSARRSKFIRGELKSWRARRIAERGAARTA
jgi:predicted DNA-binding transcriptional regulator AlpA